MDSRGRLASTADSPRGRLSYAAACRAALLLAHLIAALGGLRLELH
jgi:hypothetical protein